MHYPHRISKVKRARKNRRVEQREAYREWQARQRQQESA